MLRFYGNLATDTAWATTCSGLKSQPCSALSPFSVYSSLTSPLSLYVIYACLSLLFLLLLHAEGKWCQWWEFVAFVDWMRVRHDINRSSLLQSGLLRWLNYIILSLSFLSGWFIISLYVLKDNFSHFNICLWPPEEFKNNIVFLFAPLLVSTLS